ncbi:hypothetical protein RD792_002407 [Penstemon davidsonii]|uniref:Uncharacterized protein n=1 Tax=Penstemon davidsonii TaxID=160366 RepID=A0ABR0DQX7_9LAMI|nr:hypothetical protein RD792_002407 [Penstemon davidsonii]
MCSAYFVLILITTIISIAESRNFNNNWISAVLVFGDSTVDSGNNNYLDTSFKSNFPPYGRDFANRLPTGRPVFFGPVCLAFGRVVEGLREEGASVIALVGLPPIGCIPIVITFTSGDAFRRRPCTDSLSSIALDYNQKLQNMLRSIQNPTSKIVYVDIYKPLTDMIQNPSPLGRKVGNVKGGSSSVSAFLIFGDSTVDPGNNNYITTPFRSDFWPYGKDFANQTATGRFCNGRLPNDFIAEYLGIKEYVPPYLDPTLSIKELMSGVSFASAGSGFDPLTPTISNVISLSKQLEYFKEYKGKLQAAIGEEKTKQLINNALFFVSAGTNDFVVNYFTLPIRRTSYDIPSYMNFILQESQQFFQELLDQGARRIGVVGLPPMGCLPVVITLYSDNAIHKRNCIDSVSSIAKDYNQLLQKELNSLGLKLQHSGSRIAYIDAYGPLEDMALGNKYNFEVVSSGCCGTGLLEASFMCNPKSPVCSDATKYMFWDSIHPSERAYELLFQANRPVLDFLIKS